MLESGAALFGSSVGVEPVAGGVTEVGNIIVKGGTIQWVGPNGGDWHNPDNWNTGQIPGPDDEVFIYLEGTTLDIFVSANVSVKGLILGEKLNITAGTFTLTGNSTVGGTLRISGGAIFRSEGSSADVTVIGEVDAAGGRFYATDGAKLTLPTIDKLNSSGAGHNTTILYANGTNSKLMLPNLIEITGPSISGNGYQWDSG